MMRPGDRTRALALLIAAAATTPVLLAGPAAAQRPAALAQAASGLKRGDVLPDSYRTQVVSDYQHWRLRRPPEGYAWYRVGNQFVMASMTTGIIFDIVDAG